MAKERQKYLSLEHVVRNILHESIGVNGSEYKGTPSGFDARYSSFKGKHAAPPSMGAARNASLAKISQTGGPMRAEGGINPGDVPSSAELSARGAPQESGKAPKKINERVGDDKDEQRKDKGGATNTEMIKTNPLVKHRTFLDQLTNPAGKAHPPLQPPMPQMAIPPSPQQAMQPREGPLSSTTPGAVPTPQMMAAAPNPLASPQMAAAGAAPPGDAAGHLQAASGVVDAVAQLLQHHGRQAAMTPAVHNPGAVQGESGAPVLNEPQSADSDPNNWRNKPGRRSGQTQSQIPGMIQRDQGKVPGGPGHTNPGEKQKGSLGNLLGLPVTPNSPGVPSFQPPESQVDPKMFKRPNTPGGPKIDEKTPGMPSFQPPEAIVPPSFSKGPTGKAAAAQAPTSDYQTPAGPPPTGGKMSQMGKPVEKAPEKEPEKKAEKAPEKKGRWRHAFDALAGKETSAERDQYNKERDAEDKAAKEKSPFAIPKGEPPKQEEPGTQSGPRTKGDDKAVKPASPLDALLGKETPAQRDEYNKERDKKDQETPKLRDKFFPKGGINRPQETDAEKNQDKAGLPPKGGKLSQTKQAPDEFTGIKPASPLDALMGKETQAQRDLYNKQKDKEYKEKYPEGPPYKKEFDHAVEVAKKYGKTAGVIAALLGAQWGAEKLKKLFGGGDGGGGGGSAEKDRKAGYAPVHIHGHDVAQAGSIPTSVTQGMSAAGYFGPRRSPRKIAPQNETRNEETEHENTKERRKIAFIERQHKHGDGTKERRKVPYLERRPKNHDLRHRFSSKTLQGRETIAGMDEERMNIIMREAINDQKVKREKKKTEGGFNKTKVDTHPILNKEPLDSLRGP